MKRNLWLRKSIVHVMRCNIHLKDGTAPELLRRFEAGIKARKPGASKILGFAKELRYLTCPVTRKQRGQYLNTT